MDLVDGWVSQEFQNLADVLYDYDPNLALDMVPVAEWGQLVDKSKVFRVVDTARNQIIMYADSLAHPQDILARIWGMDQRHNDVITNLEIKNAAVQALDLRRKLDEMEEQKEFVLFVARNTKSRWTHEGRVRDEHFNDLGPVRKVINK